MIARRVSRGRTTYLRDSAELDFGPIEQFATRIQAEQFAGLVERSLLPGVWLEVVPYRVEAEDE